MAPMTADELRALPAIVNLTTAARALGCGRTLAYGLARRGEFPCRVFRLGNRYLVPTAGILHTLGLKVASAAVAVAVAVEPNTPTAPDGDSADSAQTQRPQARAGAAAPDR